MDLSSVLMREEGKWPGGQGLGTRYTPSFSVGNRQLHSKNPAWPCSVTPSMTFAECSLCTGSLLTLAIQPWRRGKKTTASLSHRDGINQPWLLKVIFFFFLVHSSGSYLADTCIRPLKDLLKSHFSDEHSSNLHPWEWNSLQQRDCAATKACPHLCLPLESLGVMRMASYPTLHPLQQSLVHRRLFISAHQIQSMQDVWGT